MEPGYNVEVAPIDNRWFSSLDSKAAACSESGRIMSGYDRVHRKFLDVSSMMMLLSRPPVPSQTVQETFTYQRSADVRMWHLQINPLLRTLNCSPITGRY